MAHLVPICVNLGALSAIVDSVVLDLDHGFLSKGHEGERGG